MFMHVTSLFTLFYKPEVQNYVYNGYRSLQIRCLKLTTIARYACAFDCTNIFIFRQCACV